MKLHLSGTVDGRNVQWPIPEGTTNVGRSADAPISIPDRSVSRLHASLNRAGDVLEVEDLQSRNGTTVNGERLQGRRAVKPGDEVTFGNVALKLVSESTAQSPPLTDDAQLDSTVKLAWQDVKSVPPGDAASHEPLVDVVTGLGEFLVQHQKSAQAIYDVCLESVEKLVPYQRAYLLLLESGVPQIKASRIKGKAGGALALSSTMVDTVIHERASLLVRDALHDPRFNIRDSVILQQIRSALAVPLFDNEQVIGVLYADTREILSPYTPDHLRRLALLANILAVKITQSRLLEAEQEKERMKHEIETAARIQHMLLPQQPPVPSGYELSARLEPCTEVGGDLYDVRELGDGRYALVLGDVVGHGVGAALLMANALAAIRALSGELQDPLKIVQKVDEQIYATTDPTAYLTLFLGILDAATGELEYVNAGHQEAPAVLLAGAPPVRLEATGPPVGLLPAPLARFEAARVTLPRGALFAAWSDGIPEAHAGAADEPPVFWSDRYAILDVMGSEQPSLAALGEHVFRLVDTFLAGARCPDDRTLLLVRRL